MTKQNKLNKNQQRKAPRKVRPRDSVHTYAYTHKHTHTHSEPCSQLYTRSPHHLPISPTGRGEGLTGPLTPSAACSSGLAGITPHTHTHTHTHKTTNNTPTHTHTHKNTRTKPRHTSTN